MDLGHVLQAQKKRQQRTKACLQERCCEKARGRVAAIWNGSPREHLPSISTTHRHYRLVASTFTWCTRTSGPLLPPWTPGNSVKQTSSCREIHTGFVKLRFVTQRRWSSVVDTGVLILRFQNKCTMQMQKYKNTLNLVWKHVWCKRC